MFSFYGPDGRTRIGTSQDATPTGCIIMTSATMSGTAGTAAEAASAPPGYLFCNGAAVSRTTYNSLWLSLQTSGWGTGDGSTTFNLPDYRAYFPVGAGVGYTHALAGGALTHTHTPDAHDHSVPWHQHDIGTAASNHTHAMSHTHTMEQHRHGSTTGVSSAQNGSLYLPSSISAGTLGPGGAGLSAAELHTHVIRGATAYASPGTGGPVTADYPLEITGQKSGGAGYVDATSAGMVGSAVYSSGTPVSNETNLPPYLSINFMIKV